MGSRAPGTLKIVFTTTASSSLCFTEPIVDQLILSGHQVLQVAGDDEYAEKFSGSFRVIPMTRAISPFRDFWSFIRWWGLLMKHRPDIIVSGTPKASMLSLLAARVTGVRSRIYILHGAVWDSANGRRARLLKVADVITMRSASRVLAVSKSLARLTVLNGLTSSAPQVLGSGSVAGVSLSDYRFNPNKGIVSPRKIAFIGRLARDKNIDSLIQVFDFVKEKFDQDVELHIYGDFDESAPIPAGSKKRISIDPDIIFHGFSSEIASALVNCDVLVLPSSREGLPQVVLESHACGVPVVTWSCTGAVDAVSPKHRQFLTSVGDVQGMANRVIDVLSNEEIANELRDDGRRWVEDHFDQRMVVARIQEFIVSQD